MAEAAIDTLPDDERESVRSGTSAIRDNMAADEAGATTPVKKKTKASAKPSAAKPKKSAADRRMDSLELRMDARFNTLLEMMKDLTNSNKDSRTGLARASSVQDNSSLGTCRPVTTEDNAPSGSRRPLTTLPLESNIENEFSLFQDSPDRQSHDDEISIMPGQREKDALGLLSDDEQGGSESHHSDISAVVNPKKSDRFCQYLPEKPSENSVDILKTLFGDDISSKSSNQTGLSLDTAQEEILSRSWRCSDPEKLTAFKDDSKNCFPVHENSDSFLNVPSLDDLLEPMLIRKHGSKTMKAWGKNKQLVSQPLKAIESVAFQGHQASRLGVITVCFMQQALGSLLNKMQSKDFNIDSGIQSVRDIFAMSTKALDQVGRSGAFHHIIRRKAAVSDSGLNNLKDVQAKVLYLPLTGDGVFGKGLEESLKKRKEQKEQLTDLIPEYDTSKSDNSHKRKSSNDRDWSRKKPRYDDSSSYRNRSRNSYPYKNNDYKSRYSDKGRSNKEGSSFRIPKKQSK